MHYCGDAIAAINVYQTASCCCDDNNEPTSDCCKDEWKTLKITDDHQLADKFELATPLVWIPTTPIAYTNIVGIHILSTTYIPQQLPRPPDITQNRTYYQRYHTLIFYS